MTLGRALGAAFIVAFLAFNGTVARAQDEIKVIVAVADIERIMQEADAIAAARSQLVEIQARFQAQIQVEENELRTTEQELQQQRALLAPDVFAQRLQDFQRKAAALGEKVRSLRRTMDEGFDETLQRVRAILQEEIGKMAEERDINLVLSRSQFVYARGRGVIDITDEALNRLNRRVTPEMVKIDIVPDLQQ